MVLFFSMLGITGSNLKVKIEALVFQLCIDCWFRAFLFCFLLDVMYRKGYVCVLIMTVLGLESIDISSKLIIIVTRFGFICMR